METINYEDNESTSSFNSNLLNQIDDEAGYDLANVSKDKENGTDMPLANFVPSTDVPVPDNQNLDYRAFRYVLMEEMLKKHYSQQQPPGLVVMNSICLNAPEDCKV